MVNSAKAVRTSDGAERESTEYDELGHDISQVEKHEDKKH
jgi:hypothetical protein